MAISLKSVSVTYKENRMLQNVSLEIGNGEFIGLMGKNGSGKSTLAHCLMGLIPHALLPQMTGTVFVNTVNTNQTDIGTIAQSVGMVFQDPDMVLFNPTVREEVLFGVRNVGRKDPQEQVQKALKQVGLMEYADRDPQTLSEGQKQKLCIACVLAMGTDTIILDEPVSHLDYPNTCMVYEQLKKLHIAGKTIIVIEHDTDLVYQYADRVVILDNGDVGVDGWVDILEDSETTSKHGVRPLGRNGLTKR